MTRRELAKLYAESVAKHGDNAGLVSGGNVKLERQVVAALTGPGEPELNATATSYREALTKSSGVDAKIRDASTSREVAQLAEQASQAKPEWIQGEELSVNPITESQSTNEGKTTRWIVIGGSGIIILLLIFGAMRKKGSM